MAMEWGCASRATATATRHAHKARRRITTAKSAHGTFTCSQWLVKLDVALSYESKNALIAFFVILFSIASVLEDYSPCCTGVCLPVPDHCSDWSPVLWNSGFPCLRCDDGYYIR